MKYRIGIIGVGYVGLPLINAFAKKDYYVKAYDINSKRINQLLKNIDLTNEISTKDLVKLNNKNIFTEKYADISDCNVYIVTVPTPVNSHNKPDLSHIISASKSLANILKKNDIVIYESTVYPGVTEDICVKELEKGSNLKFNLDFFVGYSPERVNPGDKINTIANTIKITSGSTPKVAKKIDKLYDSILDNGTFLTSSIKVAEACKVIENTQRDVNIALINELAIIFNNMNIDTLEVLEAASTKWNFIDFKPGLVGGHCIGVDPYYLTFKSEELGYRPNLILNARQINNDMVNFIVEQTIEILIKHKKIIQKSKILLLGYTFKENCPDMRNTKVKDVYKKLKFLGADVSVYDPHVNFDPDEEINFISNPFVSNKKFDSIIICVSHNEFFKLSTKDFDRISKKNKILIDLKGVVKNPTWRL